MDQNEYRKGWGNAIAHVRKGLRYVDQNNTPCSFIGAMLDDMDKSPDTFSGYPLGDELSKIRDRLNYLEGQERLTQEVLNQHESKLNALERRSDWVPSQLVSRVVDLEMCENLRQANAAMAVPPGPPEHRDLVALDKHFDARCDTLSKRCDAIEQSCGENRRSLNEQNETVLRLRELVDKQGKNFLRYMVRKRSPR